MMFVLVAPVVLVAISWVPKMPLVLNVLIWFGVVVWAGSFLGFVGMLRCPKCHSFIDQGDIFCVLLYGSCKGCAQEHE